MSVDLSFPSAGRLSRGRAAVTACPGQDECGRCAAACGFGALKKPARMPIVDHEKCIGCGACVKACPRFNMRLVDGSKGEECELTVKVPLAELPETGDTLRALDAAGNDLGPARAVQAYPLPDGRNGIVRFRADRALIRIAVGVSK
ncbi:MAG: 4Fe-4S binding protein [Clostridia bacterium]|nr:4Fe-4S binding protein [Clostridia bacterium]